MKEYIPNLDSIKRNIFFIPTGLTVFAKISWLALAPVASW